MPNKSIYLSKLLLSLNVVACGNRKKYICIFFKRYKKTTLILWKVAQFYINRFWKIYKIHYNTYQRNNIWTILIQDNSSFWYFHVIGSCLESYWTKLLIRLSREQLINQYRVNSYYRLSSFAMRFLQKMYQWKLWQFLIIILCNISWLMTLVKSSNLVFLLFPSNTSVVNLLEKEATNASHIFIQLISFLAVSFTFLL